MNCASLSHLDMDAIHLLFLPLLFLALYTITQHFLHKLLNLPPTPFPNLPFIGHIYFFTKSTPFHRALSEVSRRHGPILFLRLGSRPVLLISSPSAAHECFTKNDIIFANRPNLLNGKHFGYNFTSLAWASYGDHWRNLRRISALELLSSHKLNLLSSIPCNEARTLILKLLENNNPSKNVDMRKLFFEHTYNIVTRMITGKVGVENSKEAEMFQDIVAEMSRVTLEANVADFLPFMRWFGFGNVERKLSVVQEKRDRFMENVIEERRGEEESDGGGKQKSLIEVLLDLQREEPEYYTDETIRNLFLVLVQGASHTSSNTLEWAFSLLLQHPDILTRARAEIIRDSDITKIPYLRGIINETLRMHPAAPLLTPHSSSRTCIVGGFHVPRGTILLVNAWDIQNDPRTWDDPEKFVPERFEGLEEGKNDFKYLPFGWGRRGCPGENMAKQMVGLALGSLIQCFEWESIGEIDMSEGKGVITPKVQPLRARCIPRPFVVDLLS
ncbi:cytochrome P450 81D1-like [Sesamum indicum]|uniref:Flavonoid-6-hydroxylase n=1 Tax=Sesamum indicum TaxID=4182 RepID=A0A6I9UJ14_SESIN|nr:cytochrome P450 81D1-like [Sesamum indicum]